MKARWNHLSRAICFAWLREEVDPDDRSARAVSSRPVDVIGLVGLRSDRTAARGAGRPPDDRRALARAVTSRNGGAGRSYAPPRAASSASMSTSRCVAFSVGNRRSQVPSEGLPFPAPSRSLRRAICPRQRLHAALIERSLDRQLSRPARSQGRMAPKLASRVTHETDIAAWLILRPTYLDDVGFLIFRTLAERVNARLKDEFGARSVRVRGAIKVKCHLMFGVAALAVDQILRLTQLRPAPA